MELARPAACDELLSEGVCARHGGAQRCVFFSYEFGTVAEHDEINGLLARPAHAAHESILPLFEVPQVISSIVVGHGWGGRKGRMVAGARIFRQRNTHIQVRRHEAFPRTARRDGGHEMSAEPRGAADEEARSAHHRERDPTYNALPAVQGLSSSGAGSQIYAPVGIADIT